MAGRQNDLMSHKKQGDEATCLICGGINCWQWKDAAWDQTVREYDVNVSGYGGIETLDTMLEQCVDKGYVEAYIVWPSPQKGSGRNEITRWYRVLASICQVETDSDHRGLESDKREQWWTTVECYLRELGNADVKQHEYEDRWGRRRTLAEVIGCPEQVWPLLQEWIDCVTRERRGWSSERLAGSMVLCVRLLNEWQRYSGADVREERSRIRRMQVPRERRKG